MGEPRILDLVIADLHARDAKGRETYGSSLRASSPNDALWFAYEEALDLAMYLRQAIERQRLTTEARAVLLDEPRDQPPHIYGAGIRDPGGPEW